MREQNRNTPQNMNITPQTEKAECQGAGVQKGASIIPFPISRARRPEPQIQPKPHVPPQLEVIEGGRSEAKLIETKPRAPEYHHSQLGVGHHYGKPWEVEAEMRRRLGLPPREVTEVIIAHERQIMRPDGVQVTIQLTQRALAKMQEERCERLYVPTDIPENAE